MDGNDRLVITIENCPECRGLTRETPICFINQGVTEEFARRFLGFEVTTLESQCSALGAPHCEIEVKRAG